MSLNSSVTKLAVVTTACVGLAIAGCGGGEASTAPATPASAESGSIVAHGPTYKGEPEVRIPTGPPPKKLQIKELKKGAGVEAKKGDWAKINYVGAGFKVKKKYETTWDNHKLFRLPVEGGWSVGVLDKGVKGMRVGGVRELIAPAKLLYGYEAGVYIIELVEIE